MVLRIAAHLAGITPDQKKLPTACTKAGKTCVAQSQDRQVAKQKKMNER
jgi:hypothetical protein